MGKVIYPDKFKAIQARKILEKAIKLPDKYYIRIEDLGEQLEYRLSNNKMMNNDIGQEKLIDDLLCLVVSLCQGRPDRVLTVMQHLEDYLLGEDD